MKEAYLIKNKITGHTFKLLKEECDRLVLEEPENFIVTDENYIAPIKEQEEKTSTYELVVDKNDTKEDNNDNSNSNEANNNDLDKNSNTDKSFMNKVFGH